MTRPHKQCVVAHVPSWDIFSPAGRQPVSEEQVWLYWEELEAIRLKDLEGLDQLQAAERMKVSRPTFQRILRSARNKVAQALISGLTIRVHGGHFRLATRPARCRQCGYKWQVECQDARREEEEHSRLSCPECGSDDIAVHRHNSERHSR